MCAYPSMRLWRRRLGLAALVALLTLAAHDYTRAGETVTGPARIIDGDTIEISGVRIRLEGIDAPEAGQRCNRRVVGVLVVTWACGTAAANTLDELTRGKTVACQSTGTDRYGRTLGLCAVDGMDINAEMVRRGMAWAFIKYSRRYEAVEAEARQKRVGIFEADNETASDFRARKWQTAESTAPTTAPQGCVIKGNVTRHGERIYHTPWSPWYHNVRMDADKGKRWFCNEAEAVAAGWRPAMAR